MSNLVFYYRHVGLCPAFTLLKQFIQEDKLHLHRLTNEFDEFRVDIYALADSPTSRRVAFDFDCTITADPIFFNSLIKSYREHGWEPVICTLRCDETDGIKEIRETLKDDSIPIYTTDGQLKRTCLHEQGIDVGLWIDDYFPGIAHPGAWILQINGIDY